MMTWLKDGMSSPSLSTWRTRPGLVGPASESDTRLGRDRAQAIGEEAVVEGDLGVGVVAGDFGFNFTLVLAQFRRVRGQDQAPAVVAAFDAGPDDVLAVAGEEGGDAGGLRDGRSVPRRRASPCWRCRESAAGRPGNWPSMSCDTSDTALVLKRTEEALAVSPMVTGARVVGQDAGQLHHRGARHDDLGGFREAGLGGGTADRQAVTIGRGKFHIVGAEREADAGEHGPAVVLRRGHDHLLG